MSPTLRAYALAGGALITSGLVACGSQGPYPVGLEVTGESSVTQTVREYVISEGMSSPELRTGTVGFGPDCDVAAASTGTSESTAVLDRTTTFTVIGETQSHHPLDPGEDGFGKTWASIVEVVQVQSGTLSAEQSHYEPGSLPEAWTTTFSQDVEQETSADRFLVAADEYYVRMPSLADVWSSFPTTELLTRRNPGGDDMWPSLNGNFLYTFEGKDDVDVGGRTVKADKVGVRALGSADQSQLLGECIRVGTGESRLETPDDTQTVRVDEAYLDEGCIGDFTHLEVGTEWWYRGVMVKAERTVYQVEIEDFGYEWYDTAGGGCRREIGSEKEVPEAKLFVEYKLTESTESFQATSWAE